MACAALAVVPTPPKGSSTVSPQNVKSLMSRCGISAGKTAGCTSCDSLAICQTVFVYSRHSSTVNLLFSFTSSAFIIPLLGIEQRFQVTAAGVGVVHDHRVFHELLQGLLEPPGQPGRVDQDLVDGVPLLFARQRPERNGL